MPRSFHRRGLAVSLAASLLPSCAAVGEQAVVPRRPRVGALDITAEGPELLQDEFVHVGYTFASQRDGLHREGDGELWVWFKDNLPHVRMLGHTSSAPVGRGELELLLDPVKRLMYASVRLLDVHEDECAIYPLPRASDHPDRMERLRWRRDQVVKWQEAEQGMWKMPELMRVDWTRSYQLDFLTAEQELRGVDLREGDRLVKKVRLAVPPAPDDPSTVEKENIFAAPKSCTPADGGAGQNFFAHVEFTAPHFKSSALLDLVLTISDVSNTARWPRLFVTLSAILVPGDVPVLLEDPKPPDLTHFAGVAFDYHATVYKLAEELVFDDASPNSAVGMPETERESHSSEGSIWFDLPNRRFRLDGEAKQTKVGPLSMDLVAHAQEDRIFVNVDLEAQKEQQCIDYPFPQPPPGELNELAMRSTIPLTFVSVAQVMGEDCGIFKAPLGNGRWIQIYVDMESDRAGAILRSEVLKDGRTLRRVDIVRWRTGVEEKSFTATRDEWKCTAPPVGNSAQLAHLGLRKAEHWSIELQDTLHAVKRLPNEFAVLEVLALAGDVAIMIREPEVPPLWALPRASFSYWLGPEEGPPHAYGHFAADFERGEVRMSIDVMHPFSGANLSAVLTRRSLAVRALAHAPSDAPSAAPASASEQCLSLPMEDVFTCSSHTLGFPCGAGRSGVCAAAGYDIFVCKMATCQKACVAASGGVCEATLGKPCGVFSCIASCEDAKPEESVCGATMFEGPGFTGWAVSLTAGDYDTASLERYGAGSKAISGLRVSGDGCVAKLFREPEFGGVADHFAEGAYEDDELRGTGFLHHAVESLVVGAVPLTLHNSFGESYYEHRTLVAGVRAWVDRPFSYKQVPEELKGATLFAGAYSDMVAGNMTLMSPRVGTVYVWGDVWGENGTNEYAGFAAGVPRWANWSATEWAPAGALVFSDGHTDHTMRAFRSNVVPGKPVHIPISMNVAGGVAFKPSPRSQAEEPSNFAGPATASDIGIFDGVEMVAGVECNKFSYQSDPPVELWYSELRDSVKRIAVWPKNGDREGEMAITLTSWSPTWKPVGGHPEHFGPPAEWRCQPSSEVEQPWLYLRGAEDSESRADSMPASAALKALARATGALGILPPALSTQFRRIAIEVPTPGGATPAQPPPTGAPPPATVPPAPAAPPAPTAPPRPPVDVFGPDLRSFTFTYKARPFQVKNNASDDVLRWGEGALSVDLSRRMLVMSGDGANISSGISKARTRIVYRGDNHRLHSQLEVGDFKRCWSVKIEPELAPPRSDGDAAPWNPFMSALQTKVPHARELRLRGGQRTLGIVASEDHTELRSLQLADPERGRIVEVAIGSFKTGDIPESVFDTGDNRDICEDLSYLTHGHGVLAMDLIEAFFPLRR